MPRWVPKVIALAFVGLGTFIILGWLLLRLRGLLIVLLMSLVLSFALEPVVNRLERRRVRRSVGTLISFIGALMVLGAFLFVMGRLVTTQVIDLIDRGPGYIQQSVTWIESTFNITDINVDKLLAEFNKGGKLGNLATDLAPGIVGIGATVLGLVFQGLTIALFTFYLVADGPRLRRTICAAFPPDRQRELLRVWELAIEKTGGYIYSRALLALASTLFHWVAFAMIGVPSPLALALWVGVISQFVPVVGTYLAAVLPALIALADRPASALWLLGVVAVFQQIENYVLAPRITAQTLAIHPAVAFGSVLAGSAWIARW